ncbi:MAG: hypothetical protein HY928_10805 [Elusimicrobia bacterium]|nr:hypothetical protein [Elusimicrobiota bacterium]
MTRRVLLALLLAAPARAAVTVTASSSPIHVDAPPLMRLGAQPAATPTGRASVGVGMGLSEGKPLEMLLWGGSGAVVGSMAGPLGAAVGGAAGAVVGLLYSVFVVPRVQPGLIPGNQNHP